MPTTTMTKRYAELYAAALLIGASDQPNFEVSFPNSMDTLVVAKALEELGCSVKWDRYGKFLTVSPPINWREHVA